MKKFLKVLATAAALAAVVPYKAKADENGGELKGLLWKATWNLDPDHRSESDINITFGFNNPFENENNESHLFADELVVDYCCDDSLAQAPAHSETRVYTEENVSNDADFADEAPCDGACSNNAETTGCDCGDTCGDKE